MEMLTHKVEDLMYVVRDETLEFSKEILEILQIGFAFLNELFVSVKLSGVEDDALCEGMEVLIKDIKDFLEECKRVAAPIRVKNSQPFQKAYILEHSFFTSHNLDFIVLERIKMMYGIMR